MRRRRDLGHRPQRRHGTPPLGSSLGRLATTPDQAIAVLKEAVTELDRRAAESSQAGARLWEPTKTRPALIIVIDEYAELPEAATAYTDSIARRGRAVAVNLLAATQRPTQKAMGHGAARSQMDIRITLRVRERRDVDLILGQGMYNAGWHAHTLDAPGKFLISAPEHPTPKRARAYLITDDDVAATARLHSANRPVLNPPRQHDETEADEPESQETPPAEERLWRALLDAPESGVSVAALVNASGKSRRWVYYRLKDHAKAGRAVQTLRGQWRARTHGT